MLHVPDGTVNVCSFNGRKQFYFYENGKRSYISESNRELVHRLCQKDYDQKVLRSAQKELRQLEKLHLLYHRSDKGEICDSVYEQLGEERQKEVKPILLPDSEFIKQWEKVTYEGKGFGKDAPEFYTEKGERVRSKTEILIANALLKNRIPYRYEYPLWLDGAGLIHPDFTVLNVRLRKEIYFEHLGMMDDEAYREHAFKRILTYEKNGIFPGDRLVLSHETLKNPLNSIILEKIINHYFL